MKMYLPPPGGTPTSRRGFLKRGLFGSALLALGGAGYLATRKTGAMMLPAEGLQAMTEREYAVIYAIAKRLIPPRPNFPSIDEVKVALHCDGILASVDPSARTELKQLLMLFENALAGFLFGLRTKPFTALDEVEQDAVLAERALAANAAHTARQTPKRFIGRPHCHTSPSANRAARPEQTENCPAMRRACHAGA